MPSRFRNEIQPGAFSAELVNLGKEPLLIVCEYEGILAPWGEGLGLAPPYPRAVRALDVLTRHPKHHLTVLTALQDAQVDNLLGLPLLNIIGLHGLQWPGSPLPIPDSKSLEQIAKQLQPIEGVQLIQKGWTLAAYYGEISSAKTVDVQLQLGKVQLPEGWDFVQGPGVWEYLPKGYGKAKALERLVAKNPLHRVVFFAGDDTHEDAFRVLSQLGGTAIKVGAGLTQAGVQLEAPADVVDLLEVWAQFMR